VSRQRGEGTVDGAVQSNSKMRGGGRKGGRGKKRTWEGASGVLLVDSWNGGAERGVGEKGVSCAPKVSYAGQVDIRKVQGESDKKKKGLCSKNNQEKEKKKNDAGS